MGVFINSLKPSFNSGKEIDGLSELDEVFLTNVEHFIISSGLKEIIEGTPIAKEFRKIFASAFIFDAYGKPVWPAQIVNFTTKTQYIFRINKDSLI